VVHDVRGLSFRDTRRIGELLEPLAALLAILPFWVGMAAAAHAYLAGYDWRYQTISVLLYSDQNPDGYLWAWAGLELCGLAGVTWTAALRRRCEGAIIRQSAAGLRLLPLGFLCMCCAVLPDRLLPLPKGHEIFAILAFLGICIGVTRQLRVVVGSPNFYRYQGTRARSATLRIMPLLPLIPLGLAGSTQAYLALVRPDLPWVGPSWRICGISTFLSFGLWEWISCAVLSMCLLLIWHNRPAAAGAK
jgi:hypothetical protein